ncbi:MULTISPECIES: cyanophycinase [unclassified Streptomyces]|uniref:cyanophycinase n=1 Tax=unclassified Streptomyces TaxID=2593676 RepID=UPI000EF7B7D3|nr:MULTISPECIES: cyanophycinase [unclassified Streptomyces]MZE49962.1 type 1 glutamine amidotransferase-like domain-containing protein [Streptomyces sp. SID5770]
MRAPARPARRTALACGIALAVLTAVPAAQAHTGHAARPGAETGSLVLVGGALKDDNAAVYGEIVKRAGGPAARIGVITAASVPESQDPDADDPDLCSNSACNGAYYAGLFEKHGAADAQWIPIDLDHVANADSDAVVAQVESMTGFFFGGGDQYRYLTTLLHGEKHTDSKVLAAIRAKLARGAVVSGSSAGAQIASGPDMVSGGESYEGLRDGSAPGYFDDPTRLGYIPEGGFGFLRSGLVDTHTGSYGREGRALRLAADTGHDRVYALEENTALVVDAPGSRNERMTVIGTQGVAVLDLRRAHARTTAAGWSLRDARYTYLTDGDRYDARTWTPTVAPGKKPLTARDTGPVPANPDVFHSVANPDGPSYSFRTTARELAARTRRTATATTFETGPRFTVTFAEVGGSGAWTADGTTPRTLVGLRIDIAPR